MTTSTDISIVRSLHHAHLVGVSQLGKKWLLENIIDADVEVLSVKIAVEHAEDMEKEIKNAGLLVEFK